MPNNEYTVIIEPDDGAYSVVVPALPEVTTHGDTPEQALEMAREAVVLALEQRIADGQDIPPSDVKTARVRSVSVPIPA